ncbi:MAG: RNA chaperone Hfq, partial [Clostridium sp.]|nr:RNA chaperone Hfq [Clostridium sp.]
MMVYKHSITTITPAKPILFQRDDEMVESAE